MYAYFVGLNYVFSLSIEILLTIRHPLLNSYRSRSIVYHTVSHLVAVVLVIFLGVFNGAGTSALQTCFIRKNSWGSYIMLLPVFIYYPFSIFVGIHAIISFWYTRNVKKRVYLLRYTLVMSVYAFGWLPVGVTYMPDALFDVDPPLITACLILTSISGLLANIIRFSDPVIMGKTKKKWKKQLSLGNLNGSMRESVATSSLQGDIVDFFQGMMTEGALSALVSLHFFFTNVKITSEVTDFWVKFKGTDLNSTNSDMEFIRNHCNAII